MHFVLYMKTSKQRPCQISAIVVDDDQNITNMICDLLHFGGVDVIGVGHNGKEAVDLYLKLRPDVVFLDIMMPKYDGFYAIENIRLVNEHAKILMVTCDLSETTVERLQKIPSLEVVSKPFDLNYLLKGLDKLLSRSASSIAFNGATGTLFPEISQ